MSQAKFTPGPWSVRPIDTPNQTLQNFIQPLWVAGAKGESIVRITETTHATATAEDYANARLIASAPDLLAALNTLLDDRYLADESGDWECLNSDDHWLAARAAIAKAEGGIACIECGAIMPDDAYARKYWRCARHADEENPK